jgi:hypothetical protein
MNIIEKIELQKSYQVGLATLKALEAKLRIEILEELFPAAGEGTLNTIVGDYKVKGSFGLTYSLDQKQLDENLHIMTDEERDCIKYKANLSLAAYKKLECFERVLLDECVTVKPSMPSIKIEEA